MDKMINIANGITNLKPDSLFSLTLKESRWSKNVPVHSIVGYWVLITKKGEDKTK